MKKAIFIFAAAALLITGSIFAIAQKSGGKDGMPGFGHGRRGSHGPGFGGRGGGMGMALRGLDLTDAQKAQVKEIMGANRTNVQPIMEQLKANHEKIEGLSSNGSFDEAAVTALATEQGSLMAKLVVEKERVKSQVFAILTDAQKAKAAEMRSTFEQRMKDRGPRGPRGDRTAPPKTDN